MADERPSTIGPGNNLRAASSRFDGHLDGCETLANYRAMRGPTFDAPALSEMITAAEVG